VLWARFLHDTSSGAYKYYEYRLAQCKAAALRGTAGWGGVALALRAVCAAAG
jgi:hypothetical protein